MKLTKQSLRKIVKEEIQNVLAELDAKPKQVHGFRLSKPQKIRYRVSTGSGMGTSTTETGTFGRADYVFVIDFGHGPSVYVGSKNDKKLYKTDKQIRKLKTISGQYSTEETLSMIGTLFDGDLQPINDAERVIRDWERVV